MLTQIWSGLALCGEALTEAIWTWGPARTMHCFTGRDAESPKLAELVAQPRRGSPVSGVAVDAGSVTCPRDEGMGVGGPQRRPQV